MRKVLLRWKVSSLSGIDEIDKLMEICHRIEVLGHLSTDKEGVTQLVELGINRGRHLSEISDLESFDVIETHEEDERGVLVSIRCTHPLALSALELSNIYVYPPTESILRAVWSSESSGFQAPYEVSWSSSEK